MTGFVYQWTHTPTGRRYIGSHNGNTDDGYVGGGTHFMRAFIKHGKEEFEREILYEGNEYRFVEAMFLSAVNAARNPKYFNLSNKAEGLDNDCVVECPRCKKIGKAAGMWRWHFDYCGRTDRDTITEELTCNICGKTSDAPVFRFHHFDNCGKLDRYPKQTCTVCGLTDTAIRINRWHNDWCGITRYHGKLSTCPHCGKEGQHQAMKRWHFDNCKERA